MGRKVPRPTILDSMKGIPRLMQGPRVIISAGRETRYVGGWVSVHCPKCKEESYHNWRKEGYKRLKCPVSTCGHEWAPPEKEGPEGIPDEAPVVFCPVHGCGERMKSISYEELSDAHREVRYICTCDASITLVFALYED